jgi:TRAP-type C4-dicarboxylate transport system substrate-binding protein
MSGSEVRGRLLCRLTAVPSCSTGPVASAAAVIAVLAITAALVVPGPVFAAKPKAKIELKIATIAPEGSSWMKVMDRLDEEVRAKTNGEVGLRFYPGGVQGDEAIVLKKIRSGQLQGGGFTGVGLGEIAPSLRVLEIPFLYRTIEEVHAVRESLTPVLVERLREAGWELLGWSDVGFVYLFAKQPIRSAEDLKKVRMWLWEGDPLAESLLRNVGVSPVPLPITDVVTSLQTGLIDAVYTSTLGCISLQWYSRVTHMTDLPVTHAMGAVVVSKKAFDAISPASQEIVRDLCAARFADLAAQTTRENQEGFDVLRSKGIEVVALTDAERGRFEEIGKTVREDLVGKLYSREDLDTMLQALAKARGATAPR